MHIFTSLLEVKLVDLGWGGNGLWPRGTWPSGSKFHTVFWENWSNSRLVPPSGVGAPLGNPGSATGSPLSTVQCTAKCKADTHSTNPRDWSFSLAKTGTCNAASVKEKKTYFALLSMFCWWNTVVKWFYGWLESSEVFIYWNLFERPDCLAWSYLSTTSVLSACLRSRIIMTLWFFNTDWFLFSVKADRCHGNMRLCYICTEIDTDKFTMMSMVSGQDQAFAFALGLNGSTPSLWRQSSTGRRRTFLYLRFSGQLWIFYIEE